MSGLVCILKPPPSANVINQNGFVSGTAFCDISQQFPKAGSPLKP